MSALKILAMVLIAAGILGLVYGGFTYTKENHDLKLGNLELSFKDTQTVNIPFWVGASAIVGGSLLLMVRRTNP